MRYNQNGFTLIELILVIAILGVIAVAAFPAFFGVGQQAKEASKLAIIGAVQSGLEIYASQQLVDTGYPVGPSSLGCDGIESMCECNVGQGCFGTILDSPIITDNWVRRSTNGDSETWYYLPNPANQEVHDDYIYDVNTANFTKAP